MMRSALTIAGSDPTGGAGAQADLLVFRECKVMGLSAITALTAQDGSHVSMVAPIASRELYSQIKSAIGFSRPSAIKIGMLATGDNVRCVMKAIKTLALKKVVLDTVLASSGGTPLLDKDGVRLIRLLFPLATLVTPNMGEAGALADMKVETQDDMRLAAKRFCEMGAKNVLIKGGHMKGAPIDLLYNGRRFVKFEGRRISGDKKRLHGTGCVLSAAIAGGLANGRGLKDAVASAKELLETLISRRGQ